MTRVHRLTRTGMYKPAYDHIKEIDSNIILPDYEEVDKTRKYDPSKGTTSPEWMNLCRQINKWLDEHYDMFFLDVTHDYDEGSRDEVILCYPKRTEMFEYPDFKTELPKLVLWRR